MKKTILCQPDGKLRKTNEQKQFTVLWNQPKKAGVREPGLPE